MTKAYFLKQIVEIANESTMVISMGDKVTVNMKVVKAHDNSPPYIKLINSIIKKANKTPMVISVNNDYAEIASDKFDALMGTVRVPLKALTLVS